MENFSQKGRSLVAAPENFSHHTALLNRECCPDKKQHKFKINKVSLSEEEAHCMPAGSRCWLFSSMLHTSAHQHASSRC